MKLQIKAEYKDDFGDIGTIETHPAVGGVFSYAYSWLERQGSKPISLSLPLQPEPYSDREIKPYFDGLLPEADARGVAARELGVPSKSYLKFLRDESWETLRLAPFYDLVSTAVYPELSRTMGMYVGEVSKIDKIGRDNFVKLSRELKISVKLAEVCVDEICEKVSEVLRESDFQSEVEEKIADDTRKRIEHISKR